jgi:hypothetical protein
MQRQHFKRIIVEEIRSFFESSGPGSVRPPQVTDKILPGHDTDSKVYGGSTLDLDVDGKPNNPKKLGTRDVYNDKPAYKTPKTLSEGVRYHVSNGITFDDNVYRPGTREFFDLFNEARDLWKRGLYEATETEYEIFQSEIGEWAMFEGRMVPLDFPMWDEDINEVKYKGREVKLGKAGASRSGGRAHVFVRDPKSGNIRKVSFGSSMPDAMGSGPKAKARRKSFGDRHGCSKKNDKTKAGYWACRSTKLFGRNIPGWW